MLSSDFQPQKESRPKVAVVLSSGGIKPLAAIPLFEFLDEALIPIDLLVGCSGGSVMSALRGSGYDKEKTLELISKVTQRSLFTPIDFRAVLGMSGLPFGKFNAQTGLIRPQKLKRALYEMFGDRRIEDLSPKTLLQATDIQTGEGVVMEQGLLVDAVYASSAVFPLLPPIEIDGRWLGDGYYTSSLPVMEAVKRGMDVIIAVIFHDPINTQANSYMACLSNYYTIQGDAITRFQLALSINMHEYEIIMIKVPFKNPINMWDIHHIPEIIETGRLAIDAHKEDILTAVHTFSNRSRLG